MTVKLLIDPYTKRVVYVAHNGVVPERIMIIDGGRQHLFAPSACEQASYSGTLPAGFCAQKCWNFRFSENRVEPVARCPPADSHALVGAIRDSSAQASQKVGEV